MTTGEHGGYEAAARQYNDCIRAGQIAQAVEWLIHRCPEAGNADVLLRHERRVR